MLTVTRRSVGGLAGLAGLVVVSSACDPLRRAARDGRPPSADEALIAEVVADIRRARELAAVDNKPALVTLHDTHLAALGAATSPSPSPSLPPIPRDMTTTETTLKTQLTAAALHAEDGGLARMLASMSAAVAQHTVLLR